MNKEIKTKWVAALRSGTYKQGRGVLRNANDEFCCLGVLCDLVDPTKWERNDKDPNIRLYAGSAALHPPLFVSKETGLVIEDQDVLTVMNDGSNRGQRKSFSEIADYIETNL